jgi:hypothetical protein
MCSVDGQQRFANTGYPARRPAKMVSLATTICRDQDQLFYKIHFAESAEQIDIMSALQSGYNSLTSPVSACTKASMRANPSKPKAFATISILFLHDVIAASLEFPPNNQDNGSILHLLVGCEGSTRESGWERNQTNLT